MKKIGIFCSACTDIPQHYIDCTLQLGEWIGQTGRTLVYGGADMGLMECIARTAKEHGGTIIGVVPTKLEERGRVSNLPHTLIHTSDLSERKDAIVRESDILVALPGGVGTLDEVFHVIAAATIGYHSKRIIFYNIDGFWDNLIHMLDTMKEQGFIRKPFAEQFTVVSTFEEIKKSLTKQNDLPGE